MFHNGHQLNGVITQVLDTGEDVLRELLVCADSSLWSRDTDVSFINLCSLGLGGTFVLEDIYFTGGWVPESRVVNRRNGKVLSNACDPCRQTFNSLATRDDH